MKKLLIIIPVASVIIALGLIWHFRVLIFAPIIHNEIINSELDTSSWALENEKYELLLNIDDSSHSVNFVVIDKATDTKIYNAPHSFRSWDLKKISIDNENNILVQSGDIGDTVFQFVPDKTTWIETY